MWWLLWTSVLRFPSPVEGATAIPKWNYPGQYEAGFYCGSKCWGQELYRDCSSNWALLMVLSAAGKDPLRDVTSFDHCLIVVRQFRNPGEPTNTKVVAKKTTRK